MQSIVKTKYFQAEYQNTENVTQKYCEHKKL